MTRIPAALRRLAAAAALAVAVLGIDASPVLGHGTPTLQLGAERIQPGGAIEIRGDLTIGEAFEVAVISKADGSRRVIGTIPAVEEGHFQAYVTLPSDLAEGDYLVEVAVDLSVVRAPLTVAGPPILPEAEGNEPPGQDQPIGQPGGTDAGAGAALPGTTALPVRVEPVETRAGRSPVDGGLILAAAAGGATLLVIGLRILGRPRRISTSSE